MKRFKKLMEAKVEVDDISVGVKKKKPAGVKADEPLKGYAYNEKKRVTDIDVEQSARDLELAKNKKAKEKVQNEESKMSLDDIKKKYAREIIAFQDGGKNLSSGAKMALYGYIGSDGLKTDDADEFDDFVMGLQMGKYKKESLDEGSESWEAGYKRRVVKTTKPEHKEKGYNWRIKGKDKAHLTIKLYKDKPSQEEFNKQMKRVAGHEFGG
jgi:hypothetical protein